jgi:hypothetical protein
MERQVAALSAELDLLRAQLAELRSEPGAGTSSDVPDSTVGGSPVIEIAEAMTRRNWMKAAAAAAVGGTALALAGTERAAAANGDAILIGNANTTINTGSSPTVATHNGSGAVSFLFQTGSTFVGNFAAFPAALGAWTGSALRPNGIYGFTAVDDPEAAAVVGVAGAIQPRGVRAVNGNIGGTALQSEATANGGVGIDTNGGYTGLLAEGFQHGVVASGGTSALLLAPTNEIAPPDRSSPGQPGGALDVQLLSDSGAASLWFCSAPGDPGVWQKLAGPFTAGAFHAIDPKRVYDSRSPLPSQGVLAGGSSRVVSVADGRDLVSGAVDSPGLVPEGATAITYNLTVVSTVGAGFVSVAPGSAPTFGASSINWTSSGTTIANAGVVRLDLDRQIKVFCQGGTTNFIIDVTGYYR